jgi:predicted nucleic acid-binding protein
LAADSKCSAYDCEYVALAKHLNIKLLTGDKEILRSFPETAVELSAFSGSL